MIGLTIVAGWFTVLVMIALRDNALRLSEFTFLRLRSETISLIARAKLKEYSRGSEWNFFHRRFSISFADSSFIIYSSSSRDIVPFKQEA